MSANHQIDQWHQPLRKSIWWPACLGVLFVALFGGGFGLWAATAPLASATVIRGTFVATGANRKIQHLEGGIIENILVREGDTVQPEQVLVKLSETAVGAQLRRLVLRRLTLLVTRARLNAERNGSSSFLFKPPADAADPGIPNIVKSQHAIFSARAARVKNEKITLSKRAAAVREEISGLDARKTSAKRQLALIEREVASNEALLKKGLIRLPHLLQLKRAQYKLEGDIGEFIAQTAKARQRILETKSQINHLGAKFLQEIVSEYRTVQSELDDVDERIKASRDIKRRLEIIAPVRGTVVKLNYHTTGGVVVPGKEILELLPADEKLIVEAYVRPRDKDSVYVGLSAELRLTSLSARTTPTISGDVIYVSADTIKGKSPGQVYYVARIRVGEDQFKRLGGANISPGMPTEVFVRTGEQTLLQYIVRPVLDSFARAFRET